MSLRKGDAFSVARDKMTSQVVFDSYFKLLKETYDLLDKPGQIYNCDESGMPLEHKLSRTVSPKGVKKVRQLTSGNKTQITVLACGNAIGQALPPMVFFAGKRFNHELSVGEVPGTLYGIFAGKRFNHELSVGEVPETLYGVADLGWMDTELFFNWFKEHFLKHASPCHPLLLLLDSHSSCYTLGLIKTAKDHGVIIFCLPPHTTADSQPLDTCVFGPLKTHWNNACRKYMFDHPGRIISKFQYSTLFSQAWSKGMSIDNIISGFRVNPFNPNALISKLSDSPAADRMSSETVNTNLTENPNAPAEKTVDIITAISTPKVSSASLTMAPLLTVDNVDAEITATASSVEGEHACVELVEPCVELVEPCSEFTEPCFEFTDYSNDEMNLFTKRFENGYDVFYGFQVCGMVAAVSS